MAINPITFANRVNQQFLRYQFTAFPLSDESIAAQAKMQILGETGDTPLIKGPYVSLSRAYKIGPSVEELIRQGKFHPAVKGIAQYPNIFEHQYKALTEVQAGNHVIVSTGTGSGKTEAFLYPIINDCLHLRDNSAPEGVVAVVVYPMNALAIDQLDRMREMLAGTGISFGMYVGSTPADESKIRDQVRPDTNTREAFFKKRSEILQRKSSEVACPFEERITEQEMAASPPRILLTNFNQLEILLTRGRDLGMFVDAPLKYLVFDEAHTYTGVKGAEVSLLIRRLRTFAGKSHDEVTCIGSSATIYDEEDPEAGKHFASRFFGVASNKVALVEETFEDRKWNEPLFDHPPFSSGDPAFLDMLLKMLDENDVESISSAVQQLAGQAIQLSDNWRNELYEFFRQSRYVKTIFENLQSTTHLDEAIDLIMNLLGRTSQDSDSAKIELLSILALCAIAAKDDDPLLKPKLHFFVHGLQGATGLLNELNGETSIDFYMSPDLAMEANEDRMPAAFYPITTCRVCGQHAMTTHLENFTIDHGEATEGSAEGENVYWQPVAEGLGTRVVFTNRFNIEDEDIDTAQENRLNRQRLYAYVCRFCGAFHKHQGTVCSNSRCARDTQLLQVSVIIPRDENNDRVSCPSCNTRPFHIGGRLVEPYRRIKAVTTADVHILSQDMINCGTSDDERLIVFTDNRQDAAFQAGWMQDHARRFRLRNIIYNFLKTKVDPVSLTDIEAEFLAFYQSDKPLIKSLCPEVFHGRTPEYFGTTIEEALAKYIRIQLLLEFNVRFNHTRSLENWGLVKVVYAHLNEKSKRVKNWSSQFEIPEEDLVHGIEKLLDSWRRNNRILYDEQEPIFSHYWHPSDKEVSNGFIPLMDYPPKGLKLVRAKNDRETYITQMRSNRGVTLAMGFVKKWGLDSTQTQTFLDELWQWMIDKKILIQTHLTSNRGTPLPGCAGAYQINSHALGYTTQFNRFQCNVCHRYHNTTTPKNACTTHNCQGTLREVEISEDDYNIATLLQPFNMVMAQEHSAQVPADIRINVERQFKMKGGNVNTLVATPTLEMGVDIGDLEMVLLRNVPPSSANYWQRVGRAGRRFRMAVLYTYCRNSAHDNYFFEDPYRLLHAPVAPPQFNLRNGVMIRKHIHAAILSYMIRHHSEELDSFPPFIDGYLFDDDRRYLREPFDVSSYGAVIQRDKSAISEYVTRVISQNWPQDAAAEIQDDVLESYIDNASGELQTVANRLFKRMAWTRKTKAELLQIQGERNLEPYEKRLLRRCDDYLEGLEKHSANSYTLTVLANDGYLPGYGTYNGSVVGFAERFRTATGERVHGFELSRSPSIAIREYVPGNLIYANSGKFQVSLYHLPFEVNQSGFDRYIINPETDQIQAVRQSEGYSETSQAQIAAIEICDVDLTYVSRINDEEAARFQLPVKVMGYRKESHRGGVAYQLGSQLNAHHIFGQEMRLINVGPSERVNRGEYGYWVCTVCGGVRSPFASQTVVEKFTQFHHENCGIEPERIGFSADVRVDGLLIKELPSLAHAANLGELLKKAAAVEIEMDVEDLQTIVFHVDEERCDLFLYDPMPGGSGILQQIIDNWEAVRLSGLGITQDCPQQCESSCYECLRTYRNIFYHDNLNRHLAAEILEDLESITKLHEFPEHVVDDQSEGESTLPSEGKLEELIKEAGLPETDKQVEIPITVEGQQDINRTTPDFVYKEKKIAIYLDGMSGHIHGNPQTQMVDRLITDEMEEMGWRVLRILFPELSDPTVMRLYMRKLARYLG